jgi:hypothetical protein
MLIHEQDNKLDDKKAQIDKDNQRNNTSETIPFFDIKKEIIKQLYYNVSYCIVFSIVLVFIATIDCITASSKAVIFDFDVINISIYLLTPLAVFFSLNLVLTIVMIVKRMHKLLMNGRDRNSS